MLICDISQKASILSAITSNWTCETTWSNSHNIFYQNTYFIWFWRSYLFKKRDKQVILVYMAFKWSSYLLI